MAVTSGILLFFAGVVLLVLSSDWLIQSSVKLSFLFRLSPFFIGSVLVAFGTSAPEAGVGVIAALKNANSIAVGNVIGSNIANIGLILGLCAFFVPLKVDKKMFKAELPFLFFSVALFFILSFDLIISRVDGLIFIFSFIAFCIISYRRGRQQVDSTEINNFKLKRVFNKVNSSLVVFVISLLSLAGLVYGADLMIRGGIIIAKVFNLTPWLIGVTIIAIGTSLPELAASLTAAFKKVPSISIGNIIGSCIFNILFVLGVVALIRPIKLESSILSFEALFMAIFTLLLFIVMRSGYKITRRKGLFMFSVYLFFLASLIIKRI